METILTTEHDIAEYPQELPAQGLMLHFKMVGVGPNTRAKAGNMGSRICEIVREQGGFFLIGENLDEIRKTMHTLVDRFCDSQEEKT